MADECRHLDDCPRCRAQATPERHERRPRTYQERAATHYRDLDGKARPFPAVADGVRCAECGVETYVAEYHPWIACQLIKAGHSSRQVRANLNAVIEFGRRDAYGGGGEIG